MKVATKVTTTVPETGTLLCVFCEPKCRLPDLFGAFSWLFPVFPRLRLAALCFFVAILLLNSHSVELLPHRRCIIRMHILRRGGEDVRAEAAPEISVYEYV